MVPPPYAVDSPQSDDDAFYHFEGRLMPARSPYFLPADAVELERLEGVHRLAHAVIGKHYIGPVESMLSTPSSDGMRRKVLDIGTGTGSWVRDMAQLYPKVEFVGMDINPIPVPAPPSDSIAGLLVPSYSEDGSPPDMPPPGYQECPNVRFIERDATLGLKCPDAFYDIIHIRYVMTLSVKDPRALLRECTRALKPGGLLLLAESTVPFSLADGTDPPPGSACMELCQAVRAALREMGLHPNLRLQLENLVKTDGHYELWDTKEVPLPLGTWPRDPHIQRYGQLGLENLIEGLRSLGPLLRQSGYDDGRISLLMSRIHAELEMSLRRPGTGNGLAFLVMYLWARKEGGFIYR